MTVFRWIIGVISALMVGASVLSFVLFIASGTDEWLGRARNLRRLAFASLMLWFNIEIWRRVILIIIHWH